MNNDWFLKPVEVKTKYNPDQMDCVGTVVEILDNDFFLVELPTTSGGWFVETVHKSDLIAGTGG